MVRNKSQPLQQSSPSSSSSSSPSPKSPAMESTKNSPPSKCKQCELALNRKGENRPGIHCKDCKREHCFRCAEVTAQFCEAVKAMGKDMWCCGECEEKTVAMKSVLDKIETLHTEIVDIKKGQEGQHAEQERVLEGIKVVEAIVKRMEVVEKTQADHGDRLLEQEAVTKKHTEKIVETEERTTAIEKRLEKIDSGVVNVMQTNAIIREMREIEKSEKKLIIANLPESTEEDAVERKREDERRVGDVFKQLKMEHVKPINVLRVGFGGRYPKKVLVILRSVEETEKILQGAETMTLPNDIWLSRERTWNQREEARILREDRGKREAEGAAPPPRGRPRGSGKGPGRPKKAEGSVRGRGSRPETSNSRKRQISGEDDSSKWRRTGETGRGRGTGGRGGRGNSRGATGGSGGAVGGGVGAAGGARGADSEKTNDSPSHPSTSVLSGGLKTPEDNSRSQPSRSSDRPATPRPNTNALLGAVGGQEEDNF